MQLQKVLKKVSKGLRLRSWRKTATVQQEPDSRESGGTNTSSSKRDRLDTDNMSELSTEDLDFICSANVDALHGLPLGQSPTAASREAMQGPSASLADDSARQATLAPPAEARPRGLPLGQPPTASSRDALQVPAAPIARQTTRQETWTPPAEDRPCEEAILQEDMALIEWH
eukprot:CAMPEP_0184288876 /NCGR_PEP_ID=MMETSP1049-20130417/1377_1 /TAXON_ID=77928 /ORGANISM="Proteomonas sulcata, Strain CCMP704" /LENGTH=171 /DNA_ID=CAMNT_0026595467 /DNA_START=280 /DNA_END=796 /DNA_ORIENTATION=+